jgi:hypothetical protein
MLRKLTLAAIVAASLGTMALAPTAASAHPWGGGWGWGGWGYHHHYYGGVRLGLVGAGSCYVTRPVMTPWGYRLRTFNVCGY